MMRRRLALVAAAALALRLLVLAYLPNEPRKYYTFDSDEYDIRAMNLLRYGVFSGDAAPPLHPDLERTLGYPLFMEGVYALAGHVPGMVVLAQIGVGSLTVLLTYALARELGLSTRVGLAGAWLVALDPVSLLTTNRLLTETLFTTLFTGSLWLLARYWRRRDLWWAVAGGLALGLATLTRPVSEYLPLVLGPLIFWVPWRQAREQGASSRVRGAALGAMLFVGLGLAVPGLESYRNWQQGGVFTLSTVGEENLVYSLGRTVLSEAEGISQDQAVRELETEAAAAGAGSTLTAAQRLNLYRQYAARIIRRYPLLTAQVLAKGVGRILVDPGFTITCTLLDRNSTAWDCIPGTATMNEQGSEQQALGRIGEFSPVQKVTLGWGVVLLAILYGGMGMGLLQLWHARKWTVLALCLLVVGYMVMLPAAAEPTSRFRIPIMPILAILAGLGLEPVLRVAKGMSLSRCAWRAAAAGVGGAE